jgi:multidrug efflux pump subunit AcrA (membrane-fusion protein)
MTATKRSPLFRTSIYLLIFGGICLLAFLIWRFQRDRSFEYVKPTRGDITEAVYGLGKVKSDHRFEIKLGVLSTVKKLFVREGQAVHTGDKLMAFDSDVLFRAPFSGTVTLIENYDGETALPHVPILRLEDLRRRYIELSLEQEGALRIKPGQSAQVSLESLRGKVLSGKVFAVYSRDDEFLARIEVDGFDEGVLPGMTADVTIEIGKIAGANLIPLKAIQNGMIVVRRDGKRRKIKVEVDHVDGLMAEIKGDAIAAGDEVLIPRAGK